MYTQFVIQKNLSGIIKLVNEDSVRFNRKLFNILITQLVRKILYQSGHWHFTNLVVREILREEHSWISKYDFQTYTSIISLCNRYKKFEHATEIYEQFIRPNIYTSSTTIDQSSPDKVLFVCVVRAAIRTRSWSYVLSILNDASEMFHTHPDDILPIIHSILTTLCYEDYSMSPDRVDKESMKGKKDFNESFEKAIQILRWMKNHSITPTVQTLDIVLSLVSKYGESSDVEFILRLYPKFELEASQFTFHILLNRAASMNQLRHAVDILSEMRKRHLQVDEVTYNTFLKLFVNLGNERRIKQVLQEMGTQGIPFTERTVAILLRLPSSTMQLSQWYDWYQSFSAHSEGSQFIEYPPTLTSTQSIYTFTEQIKLCTEVKELDAMVQSIYESNQRNENSIDEIVLLTLANAYLKLNHPESSVSILNDLIFQRGFSVNANSISIAMRSILKVITNTFQDAWKQPSSEKFDVRLARGLKDFKKFVDLSIESQLLSEALMNQIIKDLLSIPINHFSSHNNQSTGVSGDAILPTMRLIHWMEFILDVHRYQAMASRRFCTSKMLSALFSAVQLVMDHTESRFPVASISSDHPPEDVPGYYYNLSCEVKMGRDPVSDNATMLTRLASKSMNIMMKYIESEPSAELKRVATSQFNSLFRMLTITGGMDETWKLFEIMSGSEEELQTSWIPTTFTIAELVRAGRRYQDTRLVYESITWGVQGSVFIPFAVISDAIAVIYGCGRTEEAVELYESLYSRQYINHWIDPDAVMDLQLELHQFNKGMAYAAIKLAFEEIAGMKSQFEQIGERLTIITGKNIKENDRDDQVVKNNSQLHGNDKNDEIVSYRLTEEIQKVLIEDFYPPISSSTVPGNPGRIFISIKNILL